jgi:hypothetical protein
MLQTLQQIVSHIQFQDGTATDTATLIFTVTGINDVPTASDKTISTAEDTPYVFSTSDFGYTDADDDDALVSVKITTLEDAGALQYNNGSELGRCNFKSSNNSNRHCC